MPKPSPQTDFNSPRLFVDHPLHEGAAIMLDRNQANYLGNVLRLAPGKTVLVFNGVDGEWTTTITGRKKADLLTVNSQNRPQQPLPDVHYVFAPLKHARLDYMVQKSVEMGARLLQPVLTRFTQTSRVNTARMYANAVEAAEQCGIMTIAKVAEPMRLTGFLDSRDTSRLLVFCDEGAELDNPLKALKAATSGAPGIDVLVGPEGGFADEERTLLLRQPRLVRLSLGPRILRADTAAVAALALVQTALGDWQGGSGRNPD